MISYFTSSCFPYNLLILTLTIYQNKTNLNTVAQHSEPLQYKDIILTEYVGF